MRKILALVLTITTIFAIAIPAMATDTTKFEFDVNNANFHCNDIEGENGRVWPDLTAYGVEDGKGNGGGNNKNKTTKSFTVVPIAGTTTWKLTDPVVCPSCGSDKWITFSNNKGVINGSNVQFQHPAPTRRYITIKVIYNLEIPECKVICKNAKAVCKFKCTCGGACKYEADYPGHPCTWKCGVGHECSVANVVLCKPACTCKASVSETIVTEKKLIEIAEGYLFTHTAPKIWKDGKLVSGSPISQIVKENSTFNVYYKGKGTCKCDCPKVVCKEACKLCTYTPPPPPPSHKHIAICDNCKNGQGKNHENCEDQNPETNTNYFCVKCPENNNEDLKLAQYNKNQGWTIYVTKGWTLPTGTNSGVCQCTHK